MGRTNSYRRIKIYFIFETAVATKSKENRIDNIVRKKPILTLFLDHAAYYIWHATVK